MARRHLAAAACLLAASGCATFQPTPQATSAWKQHRARVAQLGDFTLLGRFVVGGVFGEKGQVRWEQAGNQYRLRIWGPFGAGAVQISGNPMSAIVRTPEQRVETANVELALREQYGWTLPVQNLRWWVLGVPAPAEPSHVEYDASGRATLIEQANWTIEYESYVDAGSHPLPRKLALSNDDVAVKLVVDQWSGLPPHQ